MGQNLIDKHQCAGSNEAVQSHLVSIADRWEFLTHQTAEKSMKLEEAVIPINILQSSESESNNCCITWSGEYRERETSFHVG